MNEKKTITILMNYVRHLLSINFAGTRICLEKVALRKAKKNCNLPNQRMKTVRSICSTLKTGSVN